jgi:peptidoglycan-N-acetylglucosamine deacetylase
MRALAITLDLDGPAEYAGIHGLPTPTTDPLVMYGAPLTRFCELTTNVGGKGTLFAVGRDVRAEAVQALQRCRDAGFEIGNHTFNHDYRLSRATADAIHAELRRTQKAIADAIGVTPIGFRAPGYHLSAALSDAIEAEGFAYDSSILPSPTYYAVKAGVLVLYRIRGRTSSAILGSPAMAAAPRQPYRPGLTPFRRGQRRHLELPLAVATPARLPVTGASLILAPPFLRQLLLRALDRLSVVVLNLHAIEFVDPATDILPDAIVRRQLELRRPLAERLAILRQALGQLAAGREVVSCGDIAKSAST